LGANLEIEPGDHIAILGPNGAGKSTLLRLLMGIEKPEDGAAELGQHNVIPSYFEQNQSEALQLNKTALETLFAAVPDWTQTKVRSLLGSLGFSNDSVFKQVADLSGGEKARIALALIIVKPCNLLLLDEPTNHLDIPAKEMLEVAIRNYKGSLVVVSHDRYFISKIANKILEIKDGQLFLYRGNYQYYKEKKIEELKKSEEILLKAEKEAKRIAKQKLQRKKKSKKK
jgi:ATP-binding cassette subfamily F protein 3